MVKVKICGITNLEDAKNSLNAGCDALGFVFYKKSPCYIEPQKASALIKQLPKSLIKVGVFVNAKEKIIKNIAKLCGLDILQLHGNESPEFCKRFKDYKVIKAFRVKKKIDFKNILKYKTFAYLFDTFVNLKVGGTGKKFNWKLLTNVKDEINSPIFLSGGINQNNVLEAIETVHPEWLDVSSSLEIEPGRKDPKKIKEFIKVIK